ncbi:MAG: hypothetical protein ACQERT_10740 [Thermodesulfobacteriota bacterium]
MHSQHRPCRGQLGYVQGQLSEFIFSRGHRSFLEVISDSSPYLVSNVQKILPFAAQAPGASGLRLNFAALYMAFEKTDRVYPAVNCKDSH